MDLKFNKKAPRKPLGGQMTKLKETESDDKMKFKEDDIVRLKHPTEEDKQNAKLKYYDTFKKFEGLTATVYNLLQQEIIQFESTTHKNLFTRMIRIG